MSLLSTCTCTCTYTYTWTYVLVLEYVIYKSGIVFVTCVGWRRISLPRLRVKPARKATSQLADAGFTTTRLRRRASPDVPRRSLAAPSRHRTAAVRRPRRPGPACLPLPASGPALGPARIRSGRTLSRPLQSIYHWDRLLAGGCPEPTQDSRRTEGNSSISLGM